MNKKTLHSLFLMAPIIIAVIFGFPKSVSAAPKLEKTIGNVKHYTYDSKCKGATKQNLIFDGTTASFEDTYLFIHGQVAPSPDGYCSDKGFDLCTRAAEKTKSIFVGFAMSGSGATWVNAFDFTCLYNEAKAQLSELGKTMPNNHILAAFSFGGGALKKIYTSNAEPPNVKYTLFFDACFPGWCEVVAKIPSSKRGNMNIYASNAQDNQNGPKNQEGAKKALAVSTDAIKYVYVPTNAHGSIPKICFRDHYTNDNCGQKGELKTATATNPAESASLSKNLKDAWNGTPMTLDEIQALLQKPVPKIKIPGLAFTDPALENLISVQQDGKTYLNIPYLGQYIAAVYRYGIIFISIVAVIMLIRSGVMWILSRGEDTEEIVKGMFQAVIGLGIAVGSYTILYFVNPELVKLQSLHILFINRASMPAITEEEAETDLPVDTTIAGPIDKIETVDASYFKSDSINGQNVDGWSFWQGLTDEEKKIVLPYLYKQIAPSCPEGHLVKIDDIAEWNGKKIHPAVLDSFKQVNKLAQELGFKLVPGSVHRPASVMVPLWNTGIVARYRQGRKDWATNEAKIAKPSCQTGHSMGAAVDVNLVHIKTGKQLAATDSGKITNSNYDKHFLDDPYKIILEQIFYQNKWVRYCPEHWHFEYAVTPSYKKWDGTTRCIGGDIVEKPVPDAIRVKVNEIVGFNFMN